MTTAAKPMSRPSQPIPFVDLKSQRERLGTRLDNAIGRVVDHGAFIMGPEVAELESRLATFVGARHCLSCANGTDALGLVLMAIGVGPGDAVYVPAFTFVATAEVVAWVGATPVFTDVLPDSFNMDPASLEQAIDATSAMGLRPRCVIPVDLFGQPADYGRIKPIAERHGVYLLADAAQSLGAQYKNRAVGSLGDATATSFFPAKPLGCYGDGGAVFTDDNDLIGVLKSLRVHGQGSDKYDNVRIGLNSRLDTIQAAILIEKLAIFPDEIEARQRAAERYNAAFRGRAEVPELIADVTSVWAQYTLVVNNRDRVVQACKAAGIPTAIYYPIALSQQTGYKHFPSTPGGTPASGRLSNRVISLPMHGYLERALQDYIIDVVLTALD